MTTRGFDDQSEPRARCFVIGPIGGEHDPEIRARADALYAELVAPACASCGYEAKRSDQYGPGTIDERIITQLLDASLVIADLTGPNGNVMYELAIRHAKRLPVILLIDRQTRIPFDVQKEQVIRLDGLSFAAKRDELVESIRSLEDPSTRITSFLSLILDRRETQLVAERVHPQPLRREQAASRVLDGHARQVAYLQQSTDSEWWLKGGLPSDTLPIEDADYQADFLHVFGDVGGTHILSERRARIPRAIDKLNKRDTRYLIPADAVERFATAGEPNADEFEAAALRGIARGAWTTPPRWRRARLERAVSFLEVETFQLGLSDRRLLRFEPLGEIWLGAYGHVAAVIDLCFDSAAEETIAVHRESGELTARVRHVIDAEWHRAGVLSDKREVRAFLEGALSRVPSV